MTAILTTPEELRAIVSEAVREALEEHLLSTGEVAEMLGVTVNAVGQMVRRDDLPAVQLPGVKQYKFRREDVRQWLKEQVASNTKHRKRRLEQLERVG